MDLDAFCATARAVFKEHGHSIDCRIVAGKHMERFLRQAADRPEADALIAAGGDGTISAAAAIAFEKGIPLGVLPAGTMNLFARALKIPIALQEALVAIARGEVGTVDIATANGHPFVHHFGVGIHARLVRIRDAMPYRSRMGKMLAGVRSIAVAAVDPPNFEAEFRTPGRLERRRVSGIAISNNPFGDGHIPHPDELDGGLLGVYIAEPVSTGALIKLWSDVLLGRWRSSEAVTEQQVPQLELFFPRHRRSHRAVLDGELIKLDKTVTLKVHPGALKVILPHLNEDATG
jgi:diacylglycerol kinase family enzyme